MQAVLTNAADETTGYVKLGAVDDIAVHVYGADWNTTGTIDVKICPELTMDPSEGTYHALTVDGAAKQYYGEADEVLRYGGCMLSFTADNSAADVGLWVSGANILEVTPG